MSQPEHTTPRQSMKQEIEATIKALDDGSKLFGKSPAGLREKNAADLLRRILGDPRVGLKVPQ